jgi:hypothetical protein
MQITTLKEAEEDIAQAMFFYEKQSQKHYKRLK